MTFYNMLSNVVFDNFVLFSRERESESRVRNENKIILLFQILLQQHVVMCTGVTQLTFTLIS